MDYYKRNILFFVFSLAVLVPFVSQAQIEPEIPEKKKKFNPDFIISDKQLQNEDSMDKQAIRSFLIERDSFLANYKTEDIKGTTSTASEIIYNSAQRHEINPKYLLVKLQKEQSLIEDPNPTQNQLNWATGYGVCDSCTTTDIDVKQHRGFANQVNSAAEIIRWYYNHSDTNGIIKDPEENYQIDGKKVEPSNYATAFLYTYTPHIKGNKNFWKLWQDWFEQIYPDGTLLTSYSSSDVYLIRDRKKYRFENMSALTSRFNKERIIEVPKSELARYQSAGTISLPNYSILQAGEKYYLLDNQKIRPFAGKKTVRNLGYHPAEIIEVSLSTLEKFKVGQKITSDNKNLIGQLVKIKPSDQIYYIKDEKYHLILDKKIAEINFPNLNMQTEDRSFLQDLQQTDPLKLEEGALFGNEETGNIYMIEDGKKRLIKNEQVFENLGLNWSDVTWMDRYVTAIHPTGDKIEFNQKRVKRSKDKLRGARAEESKTKNRIKESSSTEKKIDYETKVNKIIEPPSDKISYTGDRFETQIESFVVMNYNTGQILSGKNTEFSRPMASLVKPMTAFRLMIEGYKPNVKITYQPKKHKAMYNRFDISEGDVAESQDILDAYLVGSYNIAGNMLVKKFTSNESSFIKRMNRQANSWGIKDTKFVNVTGEKVANYTTAKDYARMFKQLLNYSLIKQHLSQESFYFEETDSTDDVIKHRRKNTNKLLSKEHKNFKVIAGKTGYLHEAGANLALLIEDKTSRKKFIIVTLGNPQLKNKFSEPKRLANWTVNNF